MVKVIITKLVNAFGEIFKYDDRFVNMRNV